jgi:phosphoglycerate dehydrogenase-like enzyme
MIYVNAKLGDAEHALLIAKLPGRELVWGTPTSNLSTGESDERVLRAHYAFGQPDPERLILAPALRFVQLNSAGWTRYEREDLRRALDSRGATLATSSTVYADPVAEHAIAMMMSLLRCLPSALDEQRATRGWPMEPLRARSRRLAGDTILFLGYGSIARAMVQRLRPFGPRMIGYRRRARGDEEIDIVEEAALKGALAAADHVVDLLPESASTRGFVDAARILGMKRGARFYNVGRGATVDQAALAAALRDGHLDAAYLDVTSPEPLPPDDPLWTTPRLYISPHTAGGHADEPLRLCEHFLANLAAVEAGHAPRDRVI